MNKLVYVTSHNYQDIYAVAFIRKLQKVLLYLVF